MYGKIMIHELKRNKVINIVLFFFMMLSAMLIASAIFVMTVLLNSVDYMMEQAKTPHFIQMHAGDVDLDKIRSFNQSLDYINDFHLSEMVSVDGANLYFKEDFISEAASVMDLSFVKQNPNFDFLLDLNNEVAHIEDGEIGVPIYYKTEKGLEIGDQVILKKNQEALVLTIKTFIRDSQMNPSIISSKRFLVSDGDLETIGRMFEAREYLLAYQFKATDFIDGFYDAYANAGMPAQGPSVDISLFRMMNALTDGVIVLVLILISIVLSVIGILCLRYTLISTLAEDIREIGVMKAIGMSIRQIKSIYMTKYLGLAALATSVGYLVSLGVNRLFIQNIAEYMGTVPMTVSTLLLPILGVIGTFLMIMMSVQVILRRCKKLSVVSAVTGRYEHVERFRRGLSLHKSKALKTNAFLGINAVFSNMKAYLLIMVIFAFSTFIIILPINLLTTMESPSFIRYMGVSESDLRLDIRVNDETEERVTALLQKVGSDHRIEHYGVFKTYQGRMTDQEGEALSLPIESGDSTEFEVDYLEGQSPKEKDEIGFSILAARSLDLEIGDRVEVEISDQVYDMTVTGLYQDITNGGKTGKMVMTPEDGEMLWYVVNMNVQSDADLMAVGDEYASEFSHIKVTDIETYLDQTLGATSKQLSLITIFGSIISIGIGILITALFLKMILTKESKEIAILKGIGFNESHINKQYLIRILLVLLIAVIFGSVLALSLGQQLVSMIIGALGASSITFIITPWLSYGLIPVLILISVTLTSVLTLKQRNQMTISRMLVD